MEFDYTEDVICHGLGSRILVTVYKGAMEVPAYIHQRSKDELMVRAGIFTPSGWIPRSADRIVVVG